MSLKIIFAGTPDFSVPSLLALLNSEHSVIAVYTQPDRPAGRGRHLTASPVKEVAVAAKIPVYQPKTLRDEAAQKELAALKPDLMVVAAYGLLLPEAVLNIPHYGCINIHASLLPRWRGAAPIQRAILAGDVESGITLMQMDIGLDTGDMLSKRAIKIHADETGETLHDRLAMLGAEMLIDFLPTIMSGKIAREKQDQSLVTHAAKIQKQDAKIDWQKTAIEIERQIRAYNPWPVAFSEFQGKVLRIWEGKALPEQAEDSAGTLTKKNSEGLSIATSQGVLCIKSLQLPSGKRISAQDFINAHNAQLIPGITKLGESELC